MGGGVLKRGRLINFFALKREGLFEKWGAGLIENLRYVKDVKAKT